MDSVPVLHVGCPMWTHKAWRALYARPYGISDLAAYATLCTAVEGNTTFYANPGAHTVDRWRQETPPEFRFCFKVPREVTHERRLRRCDDVLAAFVGLMSPLFDRMGPVWIQLPAAFGPSDLDVLDRFLAGLPAIGPGWGVEVRNPAFEAEGPAERSLHDILFRRGVERVLIDTRALFAGPRLTPGEIEAWQRKPRMRVRPVALGPHPTVRFVGQTASDANPPWWKPWVEKVAMWLREGREPFVFVHTPDNVESPELCRRFHAEVAEKVPGLRPLPEPSLPGEQLGMF